LGRNGTTTLHKTARTYGRGQRPRLNMCEKKSLTRFRETKNPKNLPFRGTPRWVGAGKHFTYDYLMPAKPSFDLKLATFTCKQTPPKCAILGPKQSVQLFLGNYRLVFCLSGGLHTPKRQRLAFYSVGGGWLGPSTTPWQVL